MEQEIRKIAFNIYAASDEEAEHGRKAIVRFINIVGQHGAKVSGERIEEAVRRLEKSPFVLSQIIKFFKEKR